MLKYRCDRLPAHLAPAAPAMARPKWRVCLRRPPRAHRIGNLISSRPAAASEAASWRLRAHRRGPRERIDGAARPGLAILRARAGHSRQNGRGGGPGTSRHSLVALLLPDTFRLTSLHPVGI